MPIGASEDVRAAVSFAAAASERERATKTHDRIKLTARRSFNKHVVSEIGGFASLFNLDIERFPEPVLVTASAGLGTKLQLAAELGLHGGLGGDLVNHCVNDVAIQGATPLFFHDYFAAGELDPLLAAQVVGGMVEACKSNGCALLGGETSEISTLYRGKAYDAAGFLVGVVSKSRLITDEAIQEGDVLLGLPSNGLHCSGFSLARKLLLEVAGYRMEQYVNDIGDKVAAALMRPHRSYLSPIRKLLQCEVAHGFAHITGGGLAESLPRMMPKGLTAQVSVGSWPCPPLFCHLQRLGDVPQEDMMNLFNMGIGLVAAVPPALLQKAQTALSRMSERSVVVGRVVRHPQRKVIYS